MYISCRCSFFYESFSAEFLCEWNRCVLHECRSGKSGNEAIGTVISEFGNIDEVLTEMGIDRAAPGAVQTEDPSAMHSSRIRLFGALAGVGAGFLVLGTSLVSSFAVHGYFWAGTEFFGMCFLMVGVMMLIMSLLVRTKILVSAGSIPDTILPYLRAAQSKSRTRNFRLKMIFGGIQIFSFIIFTVSDLWDANSMNATIFMVTAVSVAFAVSLHILVTERTFARVLGESISRPETGNIVMMLSVPFFAAVIMFSKFNAHHSSSGNALGVMWAFALLYMVVCVVVGMFDANRRNVEEQAARGAAAEK